MLPKKSLGQNWLRSEAAVNAIIKAGELSVLDTVLEIGPGEGVLTDALLKTGATVLAVEKDDRLISVLQTKFADQIKSNQLALIHADILDLDILKLDIRNYKLIANLPYYLTGQILRQFLESATPPERMIVMLQKEVANRITGLSRAQSRDRLKESLLSISVKAFGEPKYLKTVPAGSFYPVPKVDSAILGIFNIKTFTACHPELNQQKFFKILHLGFAHKRKLLKSNLACSREPLLACKIGEQARAEDLTLDDWLCLTKIL